MRSLSRRDVLKLAGLTLAGVGLAGLQARDAVRARISQDGKPNIILIVLDAMSALNLSVYGYSRPTTPGLEKFSKRAIVYNRHYSAGNFTSPGTASMLTGLYPWNHRALSRRSLVRRELVSNNIFHAVGKGYVRSGYSQNLWADLFLRQFRTEIEHHIPPVSFAYGNPILPISQHFSGDSVPAYYALDEFLLSTRQVVNKYPGSVPLAYASTLLEMGRRADSAILEEYPRGMPSNSYYRFRHSDVFDGWAAFARERSAEKTPWLGYFHLYSPHAPYNARAQFIGKMPPGEFPVKRPHPLGQGNLTTKQILNFRDQYDEFISEVDYELDQFFTALFEAGIFDSSYVIVTSDHGETFERGEAGHGSPLLYEPVIRIPLLISAPGQTQRLDVHTPTSNVDLLPTFAHLAGEVPPQETDGRILPGLGGEENASRTIYALHAAEASSFQPITTCSVAMIRDNWKLIYYRGYPNLREQFELYDLGQQADEKNNLLLTYPNAADNMKAELLNALDSANAPYRELKQ